MALSDKARKILWGKSANRCAICRQPLVVDKTAADSESVVGEECHIVSGAKEGPRYEADLPQSQVDDISNLLLLCRVHHKMIDDQSETYTKNVLQGIKSNHERWVEEKLKDGGERKRLRRVRFKDGIPELLQRVRTGNALFAIASCCHASCQNFSDDLSHEEVEIVGGFLQSLQDLIDFSGNLEPIEQVRGVKALDGGIKELEEHGFCVFAAREK